jgi:glyoxylase-like metal-dependent hydrolase (beta-lactamase superfamily II)
MLSIILSTLMAVQGAQQQPAAQHRVAKVRDNVYCVYGPGGNVGVVVCEDHLVMIDGQYERSLPGLLAAIKTISTKPIKYLVNTHRHGDHTDANRMIAPLVQAIVAHTITRDRLAKGQENLAPELKGGLPSILMGEADTKKQAFMELAVGPTNMRLAHFGAGHTDNDIVIMVPGTKAVHVGDLLFLEMLPYIDTESGGNFDSLVQTIGQILAWLPDDSMVIPGHGSVCDKKEFARHHAFLQEVQKHARANPAKSPKELADTFNKEPWKDKDPSPQFVTWETLFQAATGKGLGRVVRN